jgi:pimeloyl-ACP methyl ester carboxylesterase
MRRPLATITSLVLAALASTALAAALPVGAVASPRSCYAIHIPVSLPAGDAAGGGLPGGDSASQTVWAELCTPGRPAPGRPVDVTVPGATYTHQYWDWPVDPALYSFTDKALRSGQAVLDYDRLGTGKSTSPPAAALTLASDAAVLHQVIAWVRSAAGYTDVNVIGHSLGSAIAMQEAGTWPGGVSRLVLTGVLNQMAPATHAAIAADLYPASDDPQFPQAGPGYETTIPGVRGGLFYSSAASPTVIAQDETHKSVVAEDELSSSAAFLTTPAGSSISGQIRAPVLIVDGEEDALFCTGSVNCTKPASVTQFEEPYFSAAASLTVRIVPGTGHDVALHPTANESFAIINAWLRSTPTCRSPHGRRSAMPHSVAVHNRQARIMKPT